MGMLAVSKLNESHQSQQLFRYNIGSAPHFQI